HIKKLMGWCPNASTIETRKSVQFDDMMVNAPDSGGELTLTTAGWWNKWRNRVLFNSFILTVLAITWFNLGGKDNMNLFLSGLITGVFFSIGTGITEWRRLNRAAAGEYRLQFTRRKKVINYLIIVGLIAASIFVGVFLMVKTGIRISGYYAFLSGFVLFVWTQYLEVIYWERKNRKTLIVEKTSFYAVDALDIKVGSSK
ncbi:MAG: DUF1673 family protein, partial [Candidatus Methanoperedens sp.]|nr:DUF1673 family protein [Candidatus Methanoperedens sp.]